MSQGACAPRRSTPCSRVWRVVHPGDLGEVQDLFHSSPASIGAPKGVHHNRSRPRLPFGFLRLVAEPEQFEQGRCKAILRRLLPLDLVKAHPRPVADRSPHVRCRTPGASRRMCVFASDAPVHNLICRRLPLILQKRDYSKVSSYTTGVEVTAGSWLERCASACGGSGTESGTAAFLPKGDEGAYSGEQLSWSSGPGQPSALWDSTASVRIRPGA